MKEKPADGTGFAARLKELREGAGLTQDQLATETGVSRFGIAKLEQGVTEPYWPTVLKLADVLGVTPDAFLPAVAVPQSKRDSSARKRNPRAKG